MKKALYILATILIFSINVYANDKKCRHQLPRQYDVMKKCLYKIHQKEPYLFDDKKVDLLVD